MNRKIVLVLTNEYFDIPLKSLLQELLDCEVRTIYNVNKNEPSHNITKINFGIKYQLDSYMNALGEGINIILSLDEEDDYKYELLKNIGYKFEYYSISNNIFSNYFKLKRINPNLNIFRYLKYTLIIKLMFSLLSNMQSYIRGNIGFEINKGNYERIEKLMKNNIHKDTNIYLILKRYFYYKNRLKRISIDRPKSCFNVGIISNEYIPMELFYNYELEKKLSSKNISVKRYVDYPHFIFKSKYYLFKLRGICKYNIGENVVRNIYRVKKLIKQNYDGILFLKNDESKKDISTLIILKKLCTESQIPLMVLTFNEKISSLKIDNCIDTFYDMLNFEKNKKKLT